MCVWAGFARFQQRPAKGCYVHGTEPSGSEMANQLSEYQNLKQHTLTSAQRMKLVLRAVRAVRLLYKGISVQRLNAQWRTEGGVGVFNHPPP